MVSDREQHDFGTEIKNIVESEIRPGQVAIVAHLGEKDARIVDSILDRYGSIPSRIDLRDLSNMQAASGNG